MKIKEFSFENGTLHLVMVFIYFSSFTDLINFPEPCHGQDSQEYDNNNNSNNNKTFRQLTGKNLQKARICNTPNLYKRSECFLASPYNGGQQSKLAQMRSWRTIKQNITKHMRSYFSYAMSGYIYFIYVNQLTQKLASSSTLPIISNPGYLTLHILT